MEAEAKKIERLPSPQVSHGAVQSLPSAPSQSGTNETSAGAKAADAAPPKPKGKGYLVVGSVALVMALGIGGYVLLTAGEETTDDAQVAADVVPVGTRVSGQVVRVNIVENQLVKKGDVLVVIDSADYTARVKQAEAEVATATAQAAAADAQVQVVEATSKGGLMSARAMVTGSSAGVSSASAQTDAARAAVTRADVDAKKAELDLTRAKGLRQANAVAPQAVDDAQATYDSAQAALAQARAQLVLAEQSKNSALAQVSEAQGHLNQSAPVDAQIATAHAQADLAHARVDSARAALELAKLQLDYTTIVAPGDGLASRLGVHPGQMVNVGQPVIELVPTSTYVVANFKDTQLGKMHAGQRAEIRIDAYPGRTLAGKVESMSGGTGASFALLPADNATGNFVKVVQRVPVRIAWDSLPTDVPMRVGLSADVTVEVGK
ncbi:MAG: HlyD family secretion protein [Polyangiaceae bacterium]